MVHFPIGTAMMLEADIVLKGQGTDEQQMVPIVVSPPAVTSDLSFTEWISEVKNAQKGIDLHFHSTDAVELTLQSLQELKQVDMPATSNNMHNKTAFQMVQTAFQIYGANCLSNGAIRALWV